ncbi:MAG: hypothetical protein IPP90_03105 [Gemmatimonadaceae bacterium]|nr:hypothetical protein [Gemmatimonadaceae bacterium]
MRSSRVFSGVALLTMLVSVASATTLDAQGSGARPPLADSVAPSDPIARLQARINSGDVVFARDSTFGYLPALLKALNIPLSSQGLVFSRTSLQTDKIAPWTPRAIFFNDDVYVGYVPESHFLEIAAVDAKAGAVFYTLSHEPRARPTFSRETTTCLMCHQSKAATGGVPGFMVLSTLADRYGYPIVGAHEGTTTDATPVKQRFGGWYVTGTHGTTGHSGNVFSPKLGHEVYDKQEYRKQFSLTTESARKDLSDKFDPSIHLTGHSDIVALMVLVHQTTVHNLITITHDAARDVLRFAPAADGARTATADDYSTGPAARLKYAVDRLVRAMLFVDEAPLDGVMRGTTGFTEDFARQGVRDRTGRSLRDFDLEHRLFKYPLSFLIYSESFDALPDVARREVYRRLWVVLGGADANPDFQRLSDVDRTAVREILAATKPEFAAMRPR